MIIAAVSSNGIIGKRGDLPWYLPADLRRFKALTSGKTVVMGRNTYESILARLGHALPNRRNVVITSHAIDADDIELAGSFDEAMELCDHDCYVIGGAMLYEAAMPVAGTFELTEVAAAIDGDVAFPTFERSAWHETFREHHARDERNQYDYDFVTLKKN